MLELRTLLTSIVVTTSSDVVDSQDNLTSLREALAAANSNADASVITFGDGSSTAGGTNFLNASPDSIVLSGTELPISTAMTIVGPGARKLTIDGGLASRIFNISVNGINVSLSGVKLTHGTAAGGGAIRSTGNLNLSECFITENVSTDGGGGIQNLQGSLRVFRSTVSGNTSTFNGGGIESSGSLLLVNSTIANNVSAPDTAGGIYASGTLKIVNSTITGNRGDFGSGVLASGTIGIVNSIIAGNIDSNSANPQLGTALGAVPSVVSSLIEGDISAIFVGADEGGVFVPLLTDNGGPVPTIAIKLNGPAYNTGDSTRATEDGEVGSVPLETDQRGFGFTRNLFGAVDIGAFESIEFDQPTGTAGNDAFVLTASGNSTTGLFSLTRSTDGGPVISFGFFPMSVPIVLNGDGGTDSVRLAGSDTADIMSVQGSGLSINGAGVTLLNLENRTLAGGEGSDVYRFNADSSLGLWTLDESGTGTDLLDFSLTSIAITTFLGTSTTQIINSNLSLKLNSSTAFENATGGTGDDTLIGNTAANVLTGNGGNDVFFGGLGNDTLAGGAGNDTYNFSPATAGTEADIVTEPAGGGTDTLSFASISTNVTLNMTLTTVQSVHANRTLKLNSGGVFENANGGSANDTIAGNSLSNVLTGNAGNDIFYGGLGSDSLLGGLGDDTYHFSTATPALEADSVTEFAGSGTDTLSFASISTNVTLNMTLTTVQSVHANRTLKLNSGGVFENANGGSANDTIAGNSLSNVLTGNAGNDVFYGGLGSDSLLGGLGDDTYHFSTATPALEADSVTEFAGSGTDTLSFASISTNVTLNMTLTTVQSVHANRTLSLNLNNSLESIIGGAGNDTLTGNALDNILVGNAGSDTLAGGEGRDLLIGGLGLDTLDGGNADDILIAGRTTSDTNPESLNRLRTNWISASPYASRVTALRTGVGSPLTSLKTKINVLNDAGEQDTLTGGAGTDWYLRALNDVITDLLAEESTDVL